MSTFNKSKNLSEREMRRKYNRINELARQRYKAQRKLLHIFHTDYLERIKYYEHYYSPRSESKLIRERAIRDLVRVFRRDEYAWILSQIRDGNTILSQHDFWKEYSNHKIYQNYLNGVKI